MRYIQENSNSHIFKFYSVLSSCANTSTRSQLLAASRTSAGGDAFVIVEDIYGGEGTVLCPRSRRRSSGDTSSNDGSASSSSGGGVDSVDLTIDASCAVIKIVEEYDLFSKLILEQTVINNSHVDGKAGKGRDSNSGPLISFRCTTETTVSFAEAEVSVGGSNGDVGIVSSVSGEAVARSNSTIDALYLTLLSSPDKVITLYTHHTTSHIASATLRLTLLSTYADSDGDQESDDLTPHLRRRLSTAKGKAVEANIIDINLYKLSYHSLCTLC